MSKPKILVVAHDSSLYGASKSLLTLLEYISLTAFATLFVLIPYGGVVEDEL